jgi:mRNA interferase MazF
VKRGEIYTVDLGPANGRELGGVRPVVVVSGDVFNDAPYMVAVVVGDLDPKTPEQAGIAVAPEVSGLPGRVVFLTSQLRTLDPSRFPEHATGTVPADLMKTVSVRLRAFLDLRDPTTSAHPA